MSASARVEEPDGCMRPNGVPPLGGGLSGGERLDGRVMAMAPEQLVHTRIKSEAYSALRAAVAAAGLPGETGSRARAGRGRCRAGPARVEFDPEANLLKPAIRNVAKSPDHQGRYARRMRASPACAIPCLDVPCPLPGGPVQVHLSAASPDRSAFSDIWAGRRPQLPLRGLLRLHSRYRPSICSGTQGALRRRASTQPVAQPAACQLPGQPTIARVGLASTR